MNQNWAGTESGSGRRKPEHGPPGNPLECCHSSLDIKTKGGCWKDLEGNEQPDIVRRLGWLLRNTGIWDGTFLGCGTLSRVMLTKMERGFNS